MGMVDSLTVTADELDALARRLGARRFPGVASSVFDVIGPEHHHVLTASLLAGLAARGLLAEREGRLVSPPDVAALLAPTLRGDIRYGVERVEAGSRITTAVGEVDGIVVLHRADGPYHRFDCVGTDGDVARVLASLVDASTDADADADDDPDAGPPTGRATVRCRRSRLLAAGERPELVPAEVAGLGDGWLATTTVEQAGSGSAATAAMSWISIMDSGPGRVWLVEPDDAPGDDGLLGDDDPIYRLTPVDAPGLHRRLAAWCGTTI